MPLTVEQLHLGDLMGRLYFVKRRYVLAQSSIASGNKQPHKGQTDKGAYGEPLHSATTREDSGNSAKISGLYMDSTRVAGSG